VVWFVAGKRLCEVGLVPQRVNVILAGGVLLLGLAMASLFRRSHSADAPAGPDGGSWTTLSHQAHVGPGRTAAPGGTGTRTLPPTAIPSYYARQPDRPRPPLPRPPHVPSILDRLYQPPQSSQPLQLRAVPESKSPTDQAESPRGGGGGGPARTHVIADGDTLPDLAARYLGDPKRSVEIFEANRRVLGDPEVLPLGVELRIPSATR
jgi:hypothetical protein